MIRVVPWNDLAAMAVFRRLDVHDHIEAELIRGCHYTSLGLFAEWRMAQMQAPVSLVATTGGLDTPFAVLALTNSGQINVYDAALLAADHLKYRVALARLAIAIRQRMPIAVRELKITRIEARCWADHPTAAHLLTAIGFTHEADMPGFGPNGGQTFRQFAWTPTAAIKTAPPAHPDPDL